MSLKVRLSSLRTQILAWSFVPTAIILLAVAIVAVLSYQNVAGDLAVQQKQDLIRLAAGRLGSEMDDYVIALDSVARTLWPAQGDQVALRAALKTAASRLAVFDGGVLILDGRGVALATEPERIDVLGQDWSDRPYYREVLRSSKPAISGLALDGPDDTPVIAVAVPITGNHGEFLGVAVGMFRLGATTVSALYGSIVRLRIGGDGDTYLVDQNGLVLYHTDVSRVGNPFLEQRPVREVLRGQSGALRTISQTGGEIVAAYAPVTGTSWGLITETSWEAILRPSQGYRRFLLLLLALGVLVPALVVAVGVRRITGPISRLTQAAREIADGEFGQTITAAGSDELGQLVAQFNRMSAELSASYQALRDQNERLELVMRGTNEGIWDWDIRAGVVYLSSRWKSMLGYTEQEVPNTPEGWIQLIHPDDVEHVTRLQQAYLDGEIPAYEAEHRLRHKDGVYRWILTRGTAVRDAAGKAYRLAGSHEDITARKRAEGLLEGQRGFLELLATGATLPETLDTLVEVLEAQWPEMSALVMLLHAPSQQLYVGAYGRLPAEFADALDGFPASPAAGPFGEACCTRAGVIIPDIATDPRCAGLRTLALRHGLAACWSEPVLAASGEVLGVFAMYHRTPRAPSEPELHSIQTAAHLVGVAIDHKRGQEALQIAYQTLERRVAERTRELSALNAVSAVASSSLDLHEILRGVLDEVMRVVGTETGAVYAMDAAFESFVLVAQQGLSPEFVGTVARLPVDVALAGRTFEPDLPVIWPVAEYPDGSIKDAIVNEGLESIVAVPLTAKEKLVGALVLSSHKPHTPTAEESAMLMAVGRQVGVAIENARLYEAEQTRHNEAERRRQVAEGLRDILATLNTRQSLPDTLDYIVSQACRVLESDGATLMHSPDGETLRVQASYGLEPEFVAQLNLRRGMAAAGRAWDQGRPITITDTEAFFEAMQKSGELTPEVQLSVLQRMTRRYRAVLSVPVIIRDRPYGAISLYYGDQRVFSEEDIRLAQSVADQAALAIDSAHLREQGEQAAALAERNRLARELHDSVTQNLYSMTLYAEAAARLLNAGDTAQAVGHLQALRDTSQEALREMRLLIFELRPPEIKEIGLATAIQTRLQAVEARGGIQVTLAQDGAENAVRLPFEKQEQLYQIAQEALNNALKHSRAGQVEVSLRYTEQAVRLAIQDNGRGFDATRQADSGGMGMRTMRERAQRIGGTLQIESAPGLGTRISVEAPYHGEE